MGMPLVPNFGGDQQQTGTPPPAVPMQNVADLAKKETPDIKSKGMMGAKILAAIDEYVKSGGLTASEISQLARARDQVEAVVRLNAASSLKQAVMQQPAQSSGMQAPGAPPPPTMMGPRPMPGAGQA